ncbi:hypothetical protein F443_12586 [Phytophthora nicotianae P1569]|uniref:ZSWIM1/3 RNaseH-like domain-containing protein n=1 Tax=Phytophthora nicotianae P1569 TaxID=1317065 RepID=V9ESL2_PHYNI|nr:hypothetical protein F443_12586 [Phytophthora nicotianae P1569]
MRHELTNTCRALKSLAPTWVPARLTAIQKSRASYRTWSMQGKSPVLFIRLLCKSAASSFGVTALLWTGPMAQIISDTRLNPRWTNTCTFVIDKDFVEWAIIESSFPDANVLLCQYQAMAYWKTKVLSRRCYNLTLSQRDVLETMVVGMLKRFSVYHDEELSLQVYFDENRKSCTDMWVNYARGQYFSATNTTYRVEANRF